MGKMVYVKTPKKIDVVITPYKHFGIETGFKEELVFVEKGREHPDPAGKLTWGYGKDGPVKGDWNGAFQKAGKSIKLQVDVTEAWTGHEERKLVVKAIEAYIAALEVAA